MMIAQVTFVITARGDKEANGVYKNLSGKLWISRQ
jgi:hypothetical protein